MSDCILERNSVGLSGGAVHVGAGDTVTGSSSITASTFHNNSALFGGERDHPALPCASATLQRLPVP
jgi:hypothetical protein